MVGWCHWPCFGRLDMDIELDFLAPVLGEKVRGKVTPKPVSFDAYYPRRYVEPASHFSPKVPAMLYSMATDITHLLTPDKSQEIWEMVCVGRLAKNRVPTWWVGAELFTALTETTPPVNIRWQDIKWPFPAIQFMLPIKESRKIFKRNVPCIAGSTGPAREIIKLPINNRGVSHEMCLAPSHPETMASVIIMGSCYHLTGEIDGTLSVHAPVVDNFTVGKLMTGEWPCGFEVGDGVSYIEGDKERLDLIISVFVQLLMLLSMKTDVLVSGGDCIVGAQTSGKGEHKKIIKPSLFATRWVGKHYKRPAKEHQGGTHASPEMHLRAGHWRDQRVGKGRTEIKPTWIEPVWINAPKETS